LIEVKDRGVGPVKFVVGGTTRCAFVLCAAVRLLRSASRAAADRRLSAAALQA